MRTSAEPKSKLAGMVQGTFVALGYLGSMFGFGDPQGLMNDAEDSRLSDQLSPLFTRGRRHR